MTRKDVSDDIETKPCVTADLDEALEIVGLGWCNIKCCLVLALFLVSVVVECVGYSFVLPAAKCDLNMTDAQRGFIGSIPYIGIVATSFVWGYLVDTQGRRKSLVYSSLASFVLSGSAAFMPELRSFTTLKFLVALCLACPAAAPFTYIGEILPPKHKDIMMSLVNTLQSLGAALVPIFAWVVLPLDSIQIGLYYFRSWRLLVVANASLFLVASVLLFFSPESPKYLVSQGRHDEALQILRYMYAKNQGKSPEDFPIKKLKTPETQARKPDFLNSLKVQSIPLLKPPYLKSMSLNAFLHFGLFATLNGLVMWMPDILNEVFSGNNKSMTACQLISIRNAKKIKDATICNDSIDRMTYLVSSLSNVACASVGLLISFLVKFIGKKAVLILIFCSIGLCCILMNFVTHHMTIAMLFSAIPVLGLAIGPINTFAVEIFPTNLRGMAVGLTMMVGRLGSVTGTNVAGALINTFCQTAFYLFGILTFVCGLLSFLLPKSPPIKAVK